MIAQGGDPGSSDYPHYKETVTNGIPIINLEASRDDNPPVDAPEKGRTVITSKVMAGAPTAERASHTPSPLEGVFGGFRDLPGDIKTLSVQGTTKEEPGYATGTDLTIDSAPEKKKLPRAYRLAQHSFQRFPPRPPPTRLPIHKNKSSKTGNGKNKT